MATNEELMAQLIKASQDQAEQLKQLTQAISQSSGSSQPGTQIQVRRQPSLDELVEQRAQQLMQARLVDSIGVFDLMSAVPADQALWSLGRRCAPLAWEATLGFTRGAAEEVGAELARSFFKR